MLLIKYFISSNASHISLENQYLRDLLKSVIELPGPKTFDGTILPNIYKKLRNRIKSKLEDADNICLMSDIWTAKQNSDFVALAAAIMNEDLTREIFVADMMRMPGDSHTAENIKTAIETMVIIYFSSLI